MASKPMSLPQDEIQTARPFHGFCRKAAAPLALAFALTATTPGLAPGIAAASMVGTEQVIEESRTFAAEEQSERARVAAFLSRDDVRAEMAALGVSPEEAEARLAGLSDEEVAMIAGYLGDDPAGEGFGTVLAVGIILFIVLLFTDIAGLTNIFSFTR